MKNVFALAFALVAFPSIALAQDVHLVNFTGASGAFTKVQPAVDAAVAGDVILVKAGVYDGFTIDGKGVAVMAEAGATVTIDGEIMLRNLPASEEIVLHGLDVLPPRSVLLFSGFQVLDCAGHVLFQNISLVVDPMTIMLSAALRIERCDAVAIVDSLFDATAKTTFPFIFSDAGVSTVDSSLYLHGSAIKGATGAVGTNSGQDGKRGAPGLELIGSFGLVVDCAIEGGKGGDGASLLVKTDGGDGGAGIDLTFGSSAPSAVMYDSNVAGGVPGAAVAPADPGGPGWPVEGFTSTIQSPPVSARTFFADAVVRDGETTNLSFSGEPFDFVWHIVALDASNVTYTPGIFGSFHPGGIPFIFNFMGTLNSSGAKEVGITLSPTGIDFVPVYEQALMYNLTDGFVASNPRFVAFLGSQVP